MQDSFWKKQRTLLGLDDYSFEGLTNFDEGYYGGGPILIARLSLDSWVDGVNSFWPRWASRGKRIRLRLLFGKRKRMFEFGPSICWPLQVLSGRTWRNFLKQTCERKLTWLQKGMPERPIVQYLRVYWRLEYRQLLLPFIEGKDGFSMITYVIIGVWWQQFDIERSAIFASWLRRRSGSDICLPVVVLCILIHLELQGAKRVSMSDKLVHWQQLVRRSIVAYRRSEQLGMTFNEDFT